MIDIATIERLDDKARVVLFAFAFVEDHMSLLDLCQVTGMAGTLLRGEKDVSATGQRLCEKGALRSERNRYTGLTRYELVGKFTPAALVRLLEVSIERNWWRIFGYDDTIVHTEKQSVCDFGKDLRGFVWDCTVKAFALRQLLSGEPMAVRFDRHWDEDDIQWKTVCALPYLVDFSSGERLRPRLTKRSPLGVYFKLLAVLLTRGYDVAGFLENLAVAAKEGRIALNGGEYCEFVSLCVLTGHADWTEGVLIGDDDNTCDDFINLADPPRPSGDSAFGEGGEGGGNDTAGTRVGAGSVRALRHSQSRGRRLRILSVGQGQGTTPRRLPRIRREGDAQTAGGSDGQGASAPRAHGRADSLAGRPCERGGRVGAEAYHG